MRVLLVGPDHEDNLSIRYLSATLHAHGHEAELVRFNSAADHDDVVREAAGYDVVGLSMCFQWRAEEYLALADALKAAGCPLLVMGGHYATCEADALVTHHRSIDVIVVHEGENTLLSLVEAGPDKRAWKDIAGIVYFEKGFVRKTGERRAVEELDTLPVPDRRGDIHMFAGVPTAYMLGSRGCVAKCDYCCIVTLHKMAPGKKYRRRDPERVADEMATLYHERGIRQFIFHDDNFLVPSLRHNHERIDAYARGFERNGMKDIGFTIKCRPPDADRTIFERLKGMGLLRVFFGIESASEAGLESIGRVQTIEQSQRALVMCRELDISSQYTMMMFHPDATPDTVNADLSFMRDNIDHALNFCRTEIYSGTPLEKRMIDEGRARGNYLARTYDIADASMDRACNAALDLFGDRCWAMGGLMERLIGMDHLDGIVRRFYSGPVASLWREEFRGFRRKANADLVAILTEVIERARRNESNFADEFASLEAREAAHRETLMQEGVRLRLRLDDVILPSIGVERDGDAKLIPARDPAKKGLAHHAAAVALAFSVMSGVGCKKTGSGSDAGDASSDASGDMPKPMDAAVEAAAPEIPDAAADASTDAGDLDAGKPDAGKAKPKKPKPHPTIHDHPGISEFAAPPLGRGGRDSL